MARRERPGWTPEKLSEFRSAHGLTLQSAGEALVETAQRAGITAPAANYQTLWAHEHGTVYPGPDYRRAYCLLYQATEADLGFRLPLPAEKHGSSDPSGVGNGSHDITDALTRLFAGGGNPTLRSRLVQTMSDTKSTHGPVAVLVGGYAGSGKSELARFLTSVTGWALLDKDPMTRHLLEAVLTSRGLDPHDRHTPAYVQEIRPLEYLCLLETMHDNLSRGVSVACSAPFISEFKDPGWLARQKHRCESLGGMLVPVWVSCDVESMHDYISFRSAARDAWKLANWDDYVAGLDLDLRPASDHIVIDNTYGAAVGIADRTRALQGLA